MRAAHPEKTIVVQRIAADLVARLGVLLELGWATSRSNAAPQRFRPENCSGCGWRPRCTPTCLAWSMCSMNHRRDCIRRTQRRCLRPSSDWGCGQFAVCRGARSGCDPPGRLDRRCRAGRGRARRPHPLQRTAGGSGAGRAVANAALSIRNVASSARGRRARRRDGCAQGRDTQ